MGDKWSIALAFSLALLAFVAQASAYIIPDNTGWNFEQSVNTVGPGEADYPAVSYAWQDAGDSGMDIYVEQARYRQYNTWGEPTNITDGRNQSAQVRYSGCGPYEIRNPLFVSAVKVYDEGCRPIEVYDQNNQRTRILYDALSRVEKIVGPMDTEELPAMRRIYHFGNPQTDDNFVATYNKLDGEGYLESRTFYDGIGREYKERVGAGNGAIETLTQLHPTTGLVQQFSKPYYESDGPDEDAWTAFEYSNDPLRKQILADPPGEGEVNIFYSNSDNRLVSSVFDENGNSTQHFTDAYGRERKVVDAAGEQWDYQYDGFGRLVSTIPPDGGAAHDFHYDSLGRLWRETDPEKEIFNSPQYDDTDAYEYDANGNQVWHYTELGFKEMRYDALNRLYLVKYEEYGSGFGRVPVVAYFYDGNDGGGNNCLNSNRFAKGRLCKAKRYVTEMHYLQQPRVVESSRQFGYDEEGRVVEERVEVRRPDSSYSGHTILYNYTDGGKVEMETIDGKVRYNFAYDTLGRLHYINLQRKEGGVFGEPQPAVTDITYNADGTIDAIQYGNGISADYQYTLRGWVEGINVAGQGAPVFRREYGYDPVGNMVRMQENYGDHFAMLASYGYDSLYRLRGVYDSGYYGHSYAFTYDALGNRRSFAMDYEPGVEYNYEIGENSKLRSISNGNPTDDVLVSFSYNSHGSLASKQETGVPQISYRYNVYDNMLKSVDTDEDGDEDLRFTYDEADRRVTKLTPEGWSVYLHDQFGNNVLVEEVDWG